LQASARERESSERIKVVESELQAAQQQVVEQKQGFDTEQAVCCEALARGVYCYLHQTLSEQHATAVARADSLQVQLEASTAAFEQQIKGMAFFISSLSS
jgi:hypothetical protein